MNLSKDIINNFAGSFDFLNPLYEVKVIYDQREYNSSYEAYSDKIKSDEIGVCEKISEMYNITWNKFSQNEEIRNKLILTGDRFIVNVNKEGDMFWGISNKKGDNILGFILMNIRSRLSHISKNFIETYEDVICSDFYDMLYKYGVDFEKTMDVYKNFIIDKFIEFYGYEELLISLLPVMIDNDEYDDWSDEIDYINQFIPDDYEGK